MVSESFLTEQDAQLFKSFTQLTLLFGNSKTGAEIDSIIANTFKYAQENFKSTVTYLLNKLPIKLFTVPVENRIEPSVKIFKRVFEGLLEVPDEPLLKEMFVNLLVSDMSTETKSKVHPKFASILADMTAEEAQFLQAFKETTSLPMIALHHSWNGEDRYIYHESLYTTGLAYEGIEGVILQHRTNGILLPIPVGLGSLGTELSNPYHEWYKQNKTSRDGSYQPIELSPFGKDFCQVVLS